MNRQNAPNPSPADVNYPPRHGSWVVNDFWFATGELPPELRLGYSTIGGPRRAPVLILPGSNGSGANRFTPHFAGEL